MTNDRLYCLKCMLTFPSMFDLKNADKVITIGEFIENQHDILFDNKIKHKGHRRVFQQQCPRCMSISNVNATELIRAYESFSKNKKNYNLKDSALYIEQRYGKLYKEIKKAMKLIGKKL